MKARAPHAFIKVPAAAIDALCLPDNDPGHIGASEFTLLAVLASFANADGQAWPAVATLAQRTGFSPRHVQVLLHHLEAAGLLERIPVPGRCSRYVIGVTGTRRVKPTAGVNHASGVNPGSGGTPSTPEPQFVAPRSGVHPGVNPTSPNLEASNKTLLNIEQLQLEAFFQIEEGEERKLRTLASSRHVDFDDVRLKAAEHYRGQSLRKPAVAVLRDWVERERPVRAARREAGSDDERKRVLRQVGEAWKPGAARG